MNVCTRGTAFEKRSCWGLVCIHAGRPVPMSPTGLPGLPSPLHPILALSLLGSMFRLHFGRFRFRDFRRLILNINFIRCTLVLFD